LAPDYASRHLFCPALAATARAGVNVAVGAALCAYFTHRRWLNAAAFSLKSGPKPPDLPPPQQGVFAWALALQRVSESDFLRYGGFDALVYIRMYSLAAKITATVALYALAVILPLNLTGGNLAATADTANRLFLPQRRV
jgi:Late exocytosis, associated with Golgi transport